MDRRDFVRFMSAAPAAYLLSIYGMPGSKAWAFGSDDPVDMGAISRANDQRSWYLQVFMREDGTICARGGEIEWPVSHDGAGVYTISLPFNHEGKFVLTTF